MAPSTQANFFQLFLQGQSCEEIVRLNKGWSLGAVVRARVENSWDQKRDEHLTHLMERARETVSQVTLETVQRMALEISASNKLVTDKLLRFLQSGDPQELAGTQVGTIKHLEKTIEMLQKLTGQDAKKSDQKVSGMVEHRVTTGPSSESVIDSLPVIPSTRAPLTQDTAAQLIELLHRKKQNPS